jgi:hypothetical protein
MTGGKEYSRESVVVSILSPLSRPSLGCGIVPDFQTIEFKITVSDVRQKRLF